MAQAKNENKNNWALYVTYVASNEPFLLNMAQVVKAYDKILNNLEYLGYWKT